MSSITRLRPWAVALAAGAAALATAGPALPAQADHAPSKDVPLVVRGQDTVTDGDCDDAGVCRLELIGGQFRGTPVGAGSYDGSIDLHIAEVFSNGEEGVCAPVEGRVRLGTGTPDRLVLALTGDSCQDGAGNPAQASFTTVTRFKVKRGTGKYANARGSGLATFLEDADDRSRLTLIGRLSV